MVFQRPYDTTKSESDAIWAGPLPVVRANVMQPPAKRNRMVGIVFVLGVLFSSLFTALRMHYHFDSAWYVVAAVATYVLVCWAAIAFATKRRAKL